MRFLRLTVEVSKTVLAGIPRWKLKFAGLFFIALIEISATISLPLISSRIIDALATTDRAGFRNNLLLALSVSIFLLGVSFCSRYLIIILNADAEITVKHRIFEGIVRQDFRYFSIGMIGDSMSRITNDAGPVSAFPSSTAFQLLIDVLTLISVATVLIVLDPWLAIMLVTVAPLTILVSRWSEKKITEQSRLLRTQMATVMDVVQNWLSRATGIKIYNLESVASKQAKESMRVYRDGAVQMGRLLSVTGSINGFILGIPSLLVLGVGGLNVFQSNLTIGQLFGFLSMSAFFLSPLKRIVDKITLELPTIVPVYERVKPFLLNEQRNANELHVTDSSVHSISFTDVTFTMPWSAEKVLSVENATIHKGQIVGILGQNGIGKSTLSKLLKGLYLPTTGSLTLKTSIGEQTALPASLSANVFLLSQEQVYFNGTLEENISLFDTTAKTLQLNEIMLKLNILTNGQRNPMRPGLSEGEMQKIAIARILCSTQPILVLDEPEAFLDTANRQLVKDLINVMSRDRIIVLISHTDEMLQQCNRIFTMNSADQRSIICKELSV